MSFKLGLLFGAGFFGLLAAGTAASAAPSVVSFDIKFSGHVDCVSPIELNDVPLSGKGTGSISTDGTAHLETTLTAYYFLTAKSSVTGKLGGPPVPSDGGTAQLKVLNKNGLALITDTPDTVYTINVAVDGKKCGAELIPRIKPGKKYYDIFASADAEFLCTRFSIEKSSCRIH